MKKTCRIQLMRWKNTDMITIKYLNFNSMKSEIITKLKTRSRQKGTKIEYKINTESDGNLKPLNIFKIILPRETMEQLAKHKDKRVVL